MMSRCVALRFARYGLRGVRVGEASNPGPPKTRAHPEDDPDGVLASLEHALTRIDDSSDDEPLSRPEGRQECCSEVGWRHTFWSALAPVPISEGGC